MANVKQEHINAGLKEWRSAVDDSVGRWIIGSLLALTISRGADRLCKEPPQKALGIAGAALRRLKGYKRQDATYLRRAIGEELKAYDRRQKRFRVLVPLWIRGKIPDRIRWLEHKPTIERRTWKGMLRRWPGLRDALKEYARQAKENNWKVKQCHTTRRVVPYVACITAASAQEAANAVEELLLAWRGMYEIVGGNLWAIRFGSYFTASLASVAPPLFFAVGDLNDPDKAESLFSTYRVVSAGKIDDRVLQVVRERLRDMRRVADLYPFFTKVVMRYGMGLDAYSLTERFLWSWQSIECALSGSEEMRNTKQIANLAAAVLGNDQFWAGIMHALADLRNQLVHPGSFIEGDQQINSAIRYAAAHVVYRVFNIALELESLNALAAYFQLVTRDDTTINSTIRAAKFIAESRRTQALP